ncbi:MAG: hypothetical protein ACLFQB_05355 [Chitinispirillaceae bacterium]
MPIRKFEHKDFILIIYKRENLADVEKFRNEMALEVSKNNVTGDTIIDLSTAEQISSVEISVLVRYLKTLTGTGKFLRLVVSEFVREILLNMNIHRIPNLILYENFKSLQLSISPQLMAELESKKKLCEC